MEILQAICNAVRKYGGKTPLKVWDALRQEYILVRPWLLLVPGDNPMQSEACSHIGLNANKFCRCCHVGGNQEFKRSDEGFVTLMEPARLRTVEETRTTILNQLLLATQVGGEKSLKELITATGVKDTLAIAVADTLISTGKSLCQTTQTSAAIHTILCEQLKVYDPEAIMNPLLTMPGFNVHMDTPVEPLHTHLLGIIKYFWAQTVWVLEKEKRFSDFQARLNAVSQVGLNIPKIMADYMCRYSGGLIGKHFKAISQVMVFSVTGLVSESLKNTWLTLGKLTVLLWETDIDDVAAYTDELIETIRDVQDFAAALCPNILMTKIKFHIIRHIVDHIIRFGPAVLFSTERYESFNRVFRLCSIYSNRQAPSRDIASTFANIARCQHIVTGGQWFDEERQQWISAGKHVLSHLAEHPIDRRLLGISETQSSHAGEVSLPPLSSSQGKKATRSPPILWSETTSSMYGTFLSVSYPFDSVQLRWYQGHSAIATNGDRAMLGDILFIHLEGGEYSPIVFAALVEILVPAVHADDESDNWKRMSDGVLILVRLAQLGTTLHSQLYMPTLILNGAYHLISLKDLVCVVNVQHDCWNSTCSFESAAVRQERLITERTRRVVKHEDNGLFIVNMHGLHNHTVIQHALPSTLRVWPVFFPDRQSHRLGAAAALRDQRVQKQLAKEAAARKKLEKAKKVISAGVTNGLSVGIDTRDEELDGGIDIEGEMGVDSVINNQNKEPHDDDGGEVPASSEQDPGGASAIESSTTAGERTRSIHPHGPRGRRPGLRSRK